MSFKTRVTEWFSKNNRWLFFVIFGVFLLLHVFTFRGILSDFTAYKNNDASIVREELVPFFNYSDQYMPSGASDLTGSDEFRVTYAFWSAWVRQNAILPYALVIMNTISAFVLFYAFYRLGRHFAGTHQRRMLYASAMGALVIHGVLLYSKIAHFYTLILGFSMFALSYSLVLEQMFSHPKLRLGNIAAVAALALFNPAVHYHVIFYLALFLTLLLQPVIAWITKLQPIWKPFKRNALYALILLVLTAIPYMVFVHYAIPSTDEVFNQIPVNYWMIYYSSVPLNFLFSLDTYGHVDHYLYGDYLAPVPRVLMILVYITTLPVFVMLVRGKNRSNQHQKHLLFTLLALLLLSMWMSLGYRGGVVYSFHEALGNVALFAASHTGAVASMVGDLLSVFINVLRFPHRFEFIVFYAVGLLFSLGVFVIFSYLRKQKVQTVGAVFITGLILLIPLFGMHDYRSTFLNGDFGGFLKPYRVPKDLKDIKQILAQRDNDKLFIMPSLESGREVRRDGQGYTFLDKYYIFYLDQKSVYYGSGANTDNKIASFMVYRAIAYDQSWWEDMLIRDLGVTDVLVPKDVHSRKNVVTYIPGIEPKISAALDKSSKFTKVYSGQRYDLYRAKQGVDPGKPAVLADYSWKNFLKTINEPHDTSSKLYFPIYLQKFLDQKDKVIATDSPERAFYTVLSSQKDKRFLPSSNVLPFSSDLVASSNFTFNSLSLSTLYDRNNSYNYAKEVVPSLLNTPTTQFVGVTPHNNAKLFVKTKVAKTQTYRLALHAASRDDTVTAMVDGKKVVFHRLPLDNGKKEYADFSFYTADIHLTKGKHRFEFSKVNNTLLIEYMTLLPKNAVPKDFVHADAEGIRLQPTDIPETYKLELAE